jgi:peptide/nickel transport system substrate-binding protein
MRGNLKDMKKHVLFLILAFVLIGVMVLTGCSNSSITTPAATSKTSATTASVSTSASPTAQPQYGGTLRVILGTGFGNNQGNPVVAGMGGTTSFYNMCVVEALAEFDSKGNLVPLLAQSWDMDPAAKTITFHLKKGIKFHDGTPFNAEAVKWNLDVRIVRGAFVGSDNIQSVDVVDDSTVKVTFKVFSAVNLITISAVPIFMYSPTAVKTRGDDWAKLNPVGTGPFKIVEAKVDAYDKFVRNDDYWKGKPYLDGIEFTIIPDSMVAQAMMLSKQADMWCETTTAKDAQTAKQNGLSVFSRAYLMNYICPDSVNPTSPFANKKVREALEYSIDKEALVKTFTLGFGEVLYQFSPSTTVAYVPDYKGRHFDVAKSKQLLTEAGYSTGFKTKMMTGTDQTARDIGTALQGFFSAVGIELTLDPADTARYIDAQNNGWKEGLWYGGNGINPGLAHVQFVASNFRPNQKPTMARSPEFLDVYNKLLSVPDLTSATTLGKQMNMALSDDCTAITTYSPATYRITQPYVHVNYLDIHHRVWDVNLSWMDKH